MKSSEVRYAFFVRNITALLMTFAVACALNTYFRLSVSLPFLAVAAVAADVLAILLSRCWKKAALWLTLAAIIIASVIVLEIAGFSARVLLREARDWIHDALSWLTLYMREDPETVLQPAYTVFFASTGIVCCMILFYPLSFHVVSRLALSALSLVAVVILPVLGIDLGKLPLACIGVCLVSSVIELVNMQFDRHRVESKRSAGLFLYPVSVLLVFVAVLLPARETPIRWQPVRDLLANMETVETTLKIWFGAIPEKFTITFSGMSFTDEEGSVDAEERSVLMRVSTNGMTKSPIYLRGSVSSTYTGAGWEDASETSFTERETEIELYELIYSMLRSGLMPEQGEDIYKRTTLTIEFDDIVTKSVLYAAPLSQIETEGRANYSQYGSNFRFQNMQMRGLNYTTAYFETNWGSPTLIEYLRSLTDFRYADDNTDFSSLEQRSGSAVRTLISAVNRPDPDLFNEDIADLLAERERTIREVYLQLPETLPSRVYELAQEITEACETDYDKILAIEDYFKETYQYSLTPPVFPEGRDFVDWFLFDATEGYCTYYATAAAVLARCVGLPARYVEGVTVGETLRSRDVAEITNQNVHAWTEIYLEGYGWITIEPTPGFGMGRSQEWTRRLTGAGSSAPTVPEIPPVEEQTEPPVLPENDGPSAAELAELEALRRAQMQRFWTTTAIVLAILILVLGVAALFASRRIRAKRYNRASDNEKIHILMQEILRCVAITGARIRKDETLLEYVQRAGPDFDYSDMKLSEAAMLFMEIRYAERNATRPEVVAMYRYTRELRRETLKKQNVLMRMYYAVRQYVQ